MSFVHHNIDIAKVPTSEDTVACFVCKKEIAGTFQEVHEHLCACMESQSNQMAASTRRLERMNKLMWWAVLGINALFVLLGAYERNAVRMIAHGFIFVSFVVTTGWMKRTRRKRREAFEEELNARLAHLQSLADRVCGSFERDPPKSPRPDA